MTIGHNWYGECVSVCSWAKFKWFNKAHHCTTRGLLLPRKIGVAVAVAVTVTRNCLQLCPVWSPVKKSVAFFLFRILAESSEESSEESAVEKLTSRTSPLLNSPRRSTCSPVDAHSWRVICSTSHSKLLPASTAVIAVTGNWFSSTRRHQPSLDVSSQRANEEGNLWKHFAF